jgi:hypothetical protein
MDKSETDDADDDEVSRDNEIEHARHDQNDNAGDKRDDWLKMGNSDDHEGPLCGW